MGPSIGEEAGALSVTDVAMEARNVREVDEALVLSKMGTELWLCQMVVWNTGSIRDEARALTVSEMRTALSISVFASDT